MGFEKGKPRPQGAGRKPGSLNKLTLLRQEQFRSAMEVFRGMGVSLPELGAQLVQVINAVAMAQLPNKQTEAAIKKLSPAKQDRLVKYCKIGVDAIAALMEFGYPKLARVQHKVDLDGELKLNAGEARRYLEQKLLVDVAPREVSEAPARSKKGSDREPE